MAGDFNGDGQLDLAAARGDGLTDSTWCRCCWATATARSSPRSVRGRATGAIIVAGDFTGDGKLDLAVADYG